jgi:hypothetical protein
MLWLRAGAVENRMVLANKAILAVEKKPEHVQKVVALYPRVA